MSLGKSYHWVYFLPKMPKEKQEAATRFCYIPYRPVLSVSVVFLQMKQIKVSLQEHGEIHSLDSLSIKSVNCLHFWQQFLMSFSDPCFYSPTIMTHKISGN